MKIILFVLLLFLIATPNTTDAQELTVSNIQNSGCVSKTRGTEIRNYQSVVLKKNGNDLLMELYNYYGNCGTRDFDIKAKINKAIDGDHDSLSVEITPIVPSEMDCSCPLNVSYTLHGVENNRIYLTCFWYEGLVELTYGEPLELECIMKNVTIDGLNYDLNKTLGQAMICNNDNESVFRIPTEVNYDGMTYPVTAIRYDAFRNSKTIAKVIIPKTIKRLGYLYLCDGYMYNPFFNCTTLESIEVVDDNPFLSSVDGVLLNKDKTALIKYPEGAKRTSYVMPESVKKLELMAFGGNPYLKSLTLSANTENIGPETFRNVKNLQTLDLPESVRIINNNAFAGCKFDSLIIRGILEPEYMTTSLFDGLNSLTKVFVQPSEVEKFQAIYSGKVYPIPTEENTSGINDINSPCSTTTTFDLQGRSVKATPMHGIYIKGGRKVKGTGGR